MGPIRVVLGSIHTKMPSIANIKVGDVIYPVTLEDGTLTVMARLPVEKVEYAFDYLLRETGEYNGALVPEGVAVEEKPYRDKDTIMYATAQGLVKKGKICLMESTLRGCASQSPICVIRSRLAVVLRRRKVGCMAPPLNHGLFQQKCFLPCCLGLLNQSKSRYGQMLREN